MGIFWNASGAIVLTRLGTLPINILIILLLGSLLGGFSGAHLSKIKGNRVVKKIYTLLCFLIGSSLFLKVIVKL